MSNNLDTFDNMTPISPIDTQAEAGPSQPSNAGQPNVQQATDMNSQVENSGLDTFDNMEPIIPDSMKEQGERNAKEQKQAQESENSEKPEAKRETDNLEMQEADEGADEEESGNEGEDSTSEEAESDSEEASGTELEGKTIRLKVGDEKIDINENATVPVKVKGRKEFVTLNELRENYSGKKAWGQELEKTKAQQAEMEQEREVWEGQKAEVRETFANLGQMIEDAFSNPEADPLAAMKHLVEVSGRSVLDFEKRLMDYYQGQVSIFDDMDESQRELYWMQKENEILRNNQATQARKFEERKAQEQRFSQINQVREQYGVSEEEYLEAEAMIESEGYDLSQVSPEQVSQYAAYKPLVAQAQEMMTEIKEDLSSDEYEDLLTGTADTMFKFQELSPLDALKITAKRMGLEITSDDDLIEQVNQKVPRTTSRLDGKFNAKKYAQRDEGHIESFDDFNEEFYSRNRRF